MLLATIPIIPKIAQSNNDNNDIQFTCSDVMQAEGGKLHSHLEWPKCKTHQILFLNGNVFEIFCISHT